MHLSTKSLTLSTLVVCSGVRSAPLVPSTYGNQIVAHVLEDPRPSAGQVSSDTIVISPHPRPAFVDWSSSSYVVPATVSSFNRPPVAAQLGKHKVPNITKHVLTEVAATPIKRSHKVNDSDKFYSLKVTDLQKGPFLTYKSDEERDKMLLASH